MMCLLCKRHSGKWEDLPTFQRKYTLATKDTIKSVVTLLGKHDDTRDALIERLLPLVAGWDRERAERELKPIYAAARGLTLIVASRGTKAGQATFDRSTHAGDNARKAFVTLMDALFAGSAASAVEGDAGFSVPEDVAKLAAKLAALCAQYRHPETGAEIARKLGNKALSAALSAIKAK